MRRPLNASESSELSHTIGACMTGSSRCDRGTNIDTATAGTKAFSITATDGVGHTVAQTISYTVVAAPSYQICPLYDQNRAFTAGSTVPIKLQLCDANGNNLSSASITVTALSVSAPGMADAGGSNPGNVFRFDATLGGSGGYVYDLKTRDFTARTYAMNFKVGTDFTSYTVSFKVR